MKTFARIALPLAAVLLASSAYAQDVGMNEGIVSYPASKLNWIEIPDTGGIKYANVRGDLAGKGPYEAFVIFPAGKDNPFHYHTQSIPTVILKGTFYAVVDGKRTEYRKREAEAVQLW